MAETRHIADMASKVSKDIFQVLGWERIGPTDQNWACVDQEQHGKKTHPTDVVFYYDDPYRAERVFWNTDLKSYAAKSITKASVRTAIQSLAKAVECANLSETWQKRYTSDEETWRCDGLLFVYNHDGDFTQDFSTFVGELEQDDFTLRQGRRLAILGPEEVSYLVNVASDIVRLRGLGDLSPDAKKLMFWYPDLVRTRQRDQRRSAATIEAITAPWLTLQVPPEHNEGKTRFLVYYRGQGKTVDEFRYLLDSFLRLQMLSVDREAAIDVRFVNPVPEAADAFRKAKESISSTCQGFVQSRLDNVRCETISQVQRRFSEVEIGMEAP